MFSSNNRNAPVHCARQQNNSLKIRLRRNRQLPDFPRDFLPVLVLLCLKTKKNLCNSLYADKDFVPKKKQPKGLPLKLTRPTFSQISSTWFSSTKVLVK